MTYTQEDVDGLAGAIADAWYEFVDGPLALGLRDRLAERLLRSDWLAAHVARRALPHDELSAAYHDLGTHGVRQEKEAAWDEGYAAGELHWKREWTNPYRGESSVG